MSPLNNVTATLTATQQQQQGTLPPTPTGQQQQAPTSTAGINNVQQVKPVATPRGSGNSILGTHQTSMTQTVGIINQS